MCVCEREEGGGTEAERLKGEKTLLTYLLTYLALAKYVPEIKDSEDEAVVLKEGIDVLKKKENTF